jgi:hypothetical protein
VISEEHVAGFAVEADKVFKTFEVAAALDHESKVDAEALHALGGGHGGTLSARGLAEFGGQADGTVLSGQVRDRELGDTGRMMMHIGKATEIDMPKPLMPKETKCRARQGSDNKVGSIIGRPGRRVKFGEV